MAALDFSKKSLVFITGASRGIGRTIAIELSRIIHPDSALVLIASSPQLLEDSKKKAQEVNCNVNIITYPIDLSNPLKETYEKLLDEVLDKIDVTGLHNSLFIHNAGTVGVLKNTLDITDVNVWKKYYDLNVISTVLLNSVYVEKTKSLAENKFIINMSSLCGKVPFVNMSMYGSGKAARELFFKVFSLEQLDTTVLNYSPGPVDTDMFNTVRQDAEDEGLRQAFQKTKETNVLKPEQTVKMLLDILQKGDYKSGDVIDYYDRV